METKRCPRCGETKPVDAFGRNARRPDGLQSECRLCRAAYDKQRWATHGDGIKAQRRTPEWRRRRQARNHGLTLEELDALIDRHGGLCWVCRENEGDRVDHCHRSGKRRGWLCGPCNIGLGAFADRPERLRAAAAYLKAV